MTHTNECDRLRILFRRATTLPQLPGTAVRLIEAIDSEEISARGLENIIATDPALAAKVLRVANSALAGYDTHVGTIRGAILRIGLSAVRAIALSFTVTQVGAFERVTPTFDVHRFARHSVFVGVLSRYLFARRQKIEEFETAWSADEIMAAGVLHDLAAALLACLAPEVYERSYNYARRMGATVPEAFTRIYGMTLGELSGDASEAWGLPEIFTETLRYVESPWECENEFEAIACIHYANYIADSEGYSIGPWKPETQLAPEISSDFLVGDDEMEFVLAAVERHVHELLAEVHEDETEETAA